MNAEPEQKRERVTAAMLRERWGIVVKSEFVPFSKSRNAENIKGKGPDGMSLNWRVTVCKLTPKGDHGRFILTTDYSAGIAHCPSYTQRLRSGFTASEAEAIRRECEQGKAHQRLKSIEPDTADVMYSLVSDSDVLDYPTYEEWGPNLGFDVDSRKGEAIYRACLEIALKLRAGLGEAVLAELHEAYQDF